MAEETVMKIISFAYTTPALLAGRKTVTRREWKDSWAERFKKDEFVQAYDKDARYGGKKVAVIQLTEKPYKEELIKMPFADYEGEGFRYLDENPEMMKKFLGKSYNPNAGKLKTIYGAIIRDDIGYRSMRHNFLYWKLLNPGEFLWVVRFRLIETFEQKSFLPGFSDFERTPKRKKGEAA